MFNFITQNRRGTTQEWEESNVIPRQGEFVLEELSNGANKIKIGDGINKFKDLKYIDEDLMSALLVLEKSLEAHVKYVDEGNNIFEENTVETEVLNARVAFDGTTYDSLGAAIRDNDTKLSKSIESLEHSLADFIDGKAIDGLLYDYNGEVGLKQPYMLYLTSNNDVIEESGVQIISGSGGGGGGSASELKISYVTTSPVVVTLNDTALLKFVFSGKDSSGDIIQQANSTWKVDGTTVAYGTVKDGENEFDVTKYLKVGTSKVLLSVTDDVGNIVTKTWSVQQIDVRLESLFDDKVKYDARDSIIFDYIPYGAVNKQVHFILDNKEIGVVESPSRISGSTARYELPALTHGAHLLEVYMTAKINDTDVESNHILKDIIWYDNGETDPVIGTIYQKFTANAYETTNIEYTVFDPKTETPKVLIYVDNILTARKELEDSNTDSFAYNTSEDGVHTIDIVCVDPSFDLNSEDFILQARATKTLEATIKKLDIDINPVTEGLVFDFNPVGRSNTDVDRLWSYEDVSMIVSENFDWINGGYQKDENGDIYFCIKSGTFANIDYKLFNDDAKKNGKEVKVVFKTTNVSNADKSFLSCIDNTTENDHIGLDMRVHQANIYGQSGNLELAYSEDDVIEFEFNISKQTEDIPMIMGYEDGVCTRPLVYTSSYNFKQNSDTAKDIRIGSEYCDVHLYRMKVYNTSLTDLDILNNFIADARTSSEMIERYNRNQIYDENQQLTPDVLADKCPWLHVYKLSAPYFTNNKSDKVKNTTIQQIYKDGDAVLDNWTAYNAQHSGQGTSSNNYGAAGRNLDFIMNKDGCYIELGDGTITDKITLTRTSVPVDYLNAKVNIASSNNLTNAILANRYNRFNPYKRPFVREDGTDVSFIKDTMEFHNCVIFIQETDPDLSTHREFADNNWHFYAIGNIGDSKKTDNTRATDPDDKYECCVEIMDVSLPLSDFPKDTMINAMGYTVDEEGNRTYTWATDDNLNILYERKFTKTTDTKVDESKTYYVEIDGKMTLAASQYVEVKDYLWATDDNLGILYEYIDDEYVLTSDIKVDYDKTYYIKVEIKDELDNVVEVKYNNAMGYTIKTVKTNDWVTDENLPNLYELEYFLTKDTTVNYDKTYYVDILENDDFSEDYTYGWRYLYEDGTDEENQEVFNYCKQKWIELYRFITNSSDTEFKAHLKDYFVIDSALYYYLFTTRYCMVDNRAKNTFWHYGKTSDGSRKWDLCWDYDNDTSLGLNNYGKQVYRYGYEDTDRDENNNEIFREMDSTFFCRVRDLFATELRTLYRDLESLNAWHASSFLNECDAWQNEFPEELWRIDIERKYIRTYNTSFIDGPGDSQFLENMANGRMKYQRRQWERNQERYMASKYQTARASGDSVNAQFRAGKASDGSLVPANYQFTLIPYSYMYATVRYGGTGVTPITVRVKEPGKPITIPYIGTYDDLIYVYSAADISDFGDLAPMYLQTASIGNAPRVKRLKLGASENYRNTNFSSLTTSANAQLEKLNIENLVNLTNSLDLSKFTNLTTLYAKGSGVNSIDFAEGGKISLIQAPALNTLKFKNLMYLETKNIQLEHYNNVLELSVEKCPNINALELLNLCPNIQRVRLIDVDFGETTFETFKNTFFELEGFDKDGSITDDAVLTGTVKFDVLTGSEYKELKTRYPNLTVLFNIIECKVKFIDTDLVTQLYEQTLKGMNSHLPSILDPVPEKISAPTKEQTISETFTWNGWSTKTDYVPLDQSPLNNIDDDAIFYPTFDSHVRQYTLTFCNNDRTTILNTYQVDYGTSYFEYPDSLPKKIGVKNPDAYVFKKWNPAPEDIRGDLTCYATYDLDLSFVHNIELNDIDYVLNADSKELAVTRYYNTDETIVKLLDSYEIDGVQYTVTGITGNYIDSYKTSKSIFYNEFDFTAVNNILGFKDANLEYIELPESLKYIGYQSFYNNSGITSLTLTKNIKELYDGCFEKCNGLLDIYYQCSEASCISYTTTIMPFRDTNSAVGYVVTVSNNVKSIPSYIFSSGGGFIDTYGCVTLLFEEDSTCSSIGQYAFQNSRMTFVNLPESLITIERNAFDYCLLTEIKLPSKLLTLKIDAFAHNTTLTDVYIPNSVTSIQSSSFRGANPYIEFEIESGSIFKWTQGCLLDRTNLSAVKLLTSNINAMIPDNENITQLMDYSFDNSKVKTIVIPEGVTSIGQYVIHRCENLEFLQLPSTLIEIASFGIYGTPLRSIELPINLQKLGAYSLSTNEQLESVIIPASVSNISYNVLSDCISLNSVTFETSYFSASKPEFATYAFFDNCINLKTINCNWSSDDTKMNYLRNDCPWGNKVSNVSVNFTNETIVYNNEGN